MSVNMNRSNSTKVTCLFRSGNANLSCLQWETTTKIQEQHSYSICQSDFSIHASNMQKFVYFDESSVDTPVKDGVLRCLTWASLSKTFTFSLFKMAQVVSACVNDEIYTCSRLLAMFFLFPGSNQIARPRA